MAKVAFHPRTPVQSTLSVMRHWSTSLGVWGVGAGAAALLFLSVTPLVRREVLVKVPVNALNWVFFQLKLYYEDKTPDSDKPF
ncbi:hypothetical protein K435DRAFT_959369 [Dendrothele bispora CBS 962.96]|uniref:Uncharacterized protein n=1 Tax=Dendrothele bispora (strain CBS 962.96) TaxID=1314807 RepID=A0A4S8MWZ8_DENBC|nr:hypothetical protein K435DRAFT_959369 [Dendrothele bispora CBS 962.96]